jgi:hypothetical protein
VEGGREGRKEGRIGAFEESCIMMCMISLKEILKTFVLKTGQRKHVRRISLCTWPPKLEIVGGARR